MRTNKLFDRLSIIFNYMKFSFTNVKKHVGVQIVELLIVFLIIIILEIFSVIKPIASTILIMTFIFIWSARYGLLPFLFSVSLFQIIITYFYRNKELGLDANVLSIYTITVGLALGIVGEILNRKIRTIKNENEKLELENHNLIESLSNLQSVVNQLRLRVFFEGEGLINLLERLKELEVLDLDEILTRFVEIVADFFQLTNLQLYRVEKNFLRFVNGVGIRKLPNSLAVDTSKVILKTIEKGYSTLPEIILESEIDSFEPWFCVAIGRHGDLSGVLVVEDIQPENFSEILVQYIRAIASWFHANMKIISEQEALLVEKYRKPDGTWEAEYYTKKKSIFEKRKERFGIRFEEICFKYPRVYHENIVKEFRSSDILYSEESGNFVTTKALLPVCDELGKRKVLERLTKKYEISTC